MAKENLRDRYKKFKPTNLNALGNYSKTVAKKTNTRNYPDILTLEEGENILRIFPAHPPKEGEDQNVDRYFIYSKTVHYLPIYIKDNKTGKMDRLINKPIFNSMLHGGTEKDIVSEYIKMVQALIKDKYKSATDRKAKYQLLSGYRTIEGKFISGIQASTKWVMYVKAINSKLASSKFGRIEVTPTIKNNILSLVSSQDKIDEAFIADPFTDIETGLLVSIIINSSATEKALKTIVKFKAGDDYVPIAQALTDEELNHFEKVPSLYKLYVNSYTLKDFKLAVQGVQNFDKINKFGLCELLEWKELVEEMSKLYKDDGEGNEPSIDETNPLTECTIEDLTGLVEHLELALELDVADGKASMADQIIAEVASLLELEIADGKEAIYEYLSEGLITFRAK